MRAPHLFSQYTLSWGHVPWWPWGQRQHRHPPAALTGQPCQGMGPHGAPPHSQAVPPHSVTNCPHGQAVFPPLRHPLSPWPGCGPRGVLPRWPHGWAAHPLHELSPWTWLRPPPRLCPHDLAMSPIVSPHPGSSPAPRCAPTVPCSPSWSPRRTHRATQPRIRPPRSQHRCHSTASRAASPPWPCPPWRSVTPPPAPTSKASPVKSLAQNSHLTRRLGQPCWTCSGRSRRLSLVLHRLGQGMTLKPQVPRWAWGGWRGAAREVMRGHREQPWLPTAPPRRPAGPYLEVLDEPAPAAALLAVDAADGQAQHLRLQLRVGVDLGEAALGRQHLGGTRTPQPGLAGSHGRAARGRIPLAGRRTSALCRERVSVPRLGGTKGSCFRMGGRARLAWLCQAAVPAVGDVPPRARYHVPGLTLA